VSTIRPLVALVLVAKACRPVTVGLALLAVVGAARGGRADQNIRVLLLRPVPASPSQSEAIVRIKSELSAGGFEVTVRDSRLAALPPEPRTLMEPSSELPAPSATLGIFGDLDHGTAELWVVDRITGKAVVRRMHVETSEDRPISEVLAIRAQELLRASLVEVVVEERPPVAPVQKSPAQVERASADAESSPPAWRWALELGGAALGGWGGIDPALAPTVRLRVPLGQRLGIRLTGLGFGTRPMVRSRVGSASVRQDVLLLECAAWLGLGRRIRPVLSLGIGAARFAVDGTGIAPYQGEQTARWLLAGDGGIGLAVRVGAHWEAQLDLHALVLAPRPSVRFFDVDAAHAGLPTLLAILTLAGGA
jgi:hypothetical protein